MNIVAILGHTASGKSQIAEAAARRFAAEIVSVDSMQVYRGMDIGTAKPTPQTRERIPHHMIDIAEPDEEFSVRQFQDHGLAALDDIIARGGRAIVVGGSGLHFRSLVDPLEFAPTDPAVRERLTQTDPQTARDRLVRIDPEAGAHVDLANPRRVVRALEIHELTGNTPTRRARTAAASAVRGYESERNHMSIGIDAGDEANDRVERRWSAMLDAGLLDEVSGLADRLGTTASQAVGYKELLPVVSDGRPLDEATEDALAATRALIKRQRTYFQRDPRISWLDWDADDDARTRSVFDLIESEAAWSS